MREDWRVKQHINELPATNHSLLKKANFLQEIIMKMHFYEVHNTVLQWYVFFLFRRLDNGLFVLYAVLTLSTSSLAPSTASYDSTRAEMAASFCCSCFWCIWESTLLMKLSTYTTCKHIQTFSTFDGPTHWKMITGHLRVIACEVSNHVVERIFGGLVVSFLQDGLQEQRVLG